MMFVQHRSVSGTDYLRHDHVYNTTTIRIRTSRQ